MQLASTLSTTTSVFLLVLLNGCTSGEAPMNTDELNDFATRCTAAWCSQNAASVASFFAKDGSLKINSSDPSIGNFDEVEYQRQLQFGASDAEN